ncbi:MAG: lipid-A-disaccharide synthase [Bacteroidota bacterium]|nr:lipid-A-disaccharide synthase [Bacteroidota bacterium]
MKYYIIAGEASGDLHASNLLRELKVQDPSAKFRGWGGDLMASQGCELARHYRDLDFMGFFEVALHLSTILSNIRFCKEDILAFAPDVLILVDYPGFNLRIARFAHKAGIKVFYYISPQIWAWHTSRIKSVKKNVDRMFVILPFEKEFYEKYSFHVDFVGHPLLDCIKPMVENLEDRQTFLSENHLDDKPMIALLPGSRKQEIKAMLNTMLKMVPRFPGYQFVIAAAPSVDPEFYSSMVQSLPVRFVFRKTYPLLKHSEAALVTSGTATLETALMKVPQVVCYKGNVFSYLIARKLIKVNFISLVNLIMNKQIVKELIQKDFNEKNLESELRKLVENNQNRNRMLSDYEMLVDKLGRQGASEKAARKIIQYLQ